MKEAGAAATEAVGDLDTHDTEVEEFVDELLWNFGVLVHLANERADFLIGELPDAVTKQPFVVREQGQREVPRFAGLRRHVGSGSKCYHSSIGRMGRTGRTGRTGRVGG